jgi:hypothetical protein
MGLRMTILVHYAATQTQENFDFFSEN